MPFYLGNYSPPSPIFTFSENHGIILAIDEFQVLRGELKFMKKCIAFIMIFLLSLSFVACDSDKIELGTKDGAAYFHRSSLTPEIILKADRDVKIESELFFEKLVMAIDGKPVTKESDCACDPIYNVRIDKYSFGLHSHGITVTAPLGNNIKGLNFFEIDATEEEMSALFEILAAEAQK